MSTSNGSKSDTILLHQGHAMHLGCGGDERIHHAHASSNGRAARHHASARVGNSAIREKGRALTHSDTTMVSNDLCAV